MTSPANQPEFATAVAAVNEALEGYVTADRSPARQTIADRMGGPVLSGALLLGLGVGIAAGVLSLMWSLVGALIAGESEPDAQAAIRAALIAGMVGWLVAIPMIFVPLPRLLLDRSATSWWSVSQWGEESAETHALSKEAKLAQLAGTLGRQIIDHPGWKSDWLDSHRLRLNPEQETAQIAAQAKEIFHLRQSLETLSATGPVDEIAEIQRWAALDQASTNLMSRVIALQAYIEQLDRINTLVQATGSGDPSNSIDARLDRLVGTSARDEYAADRLLSLGEEIKFTTNSILQILK